jgi:hypothetical protein
MKRILLVALCLALLIGMAYSKEMVPTRNAMTIENPLSSRPVPSTRVAPEYTFTRTPTALMTSYYDYMIGSYNGLPLQVIPTVAGGGYFLSYHGQRDPAAERRAFWAYLDAAGNVMANNEITGTVNREGYTTCAVDPVSGKPLYAWHANTDADEEMEVQFTSDAFMSGIVGLFNDLQVIVENPYSITAGSGSSTDNEFIWPTAQIGPSPVAGKSRVYIISRNNKTHTAGPSENPVIAYADFSGDDIEGGIPLVWSQVTIPEMDNWNHDSEWRRPFHSITTDDAGNVYYAGYHFATESDAATNIREADMDIFKCGNYGQGTWSRVSNYSWYDSWNPAGQQGGTGYFVGDGSVPYEDSLVVWAMASSSHLNATVDSDGKIHVLGTWAQSTKDGGYWGEFETVKEYVFDPQTEQFTRTEVYPQKDSLDTFNEVYTPWDVEAPWGEAEYFLNDDGNYYLSPETVFPFPYWDDAAHADGMYFHYPNTKITEGNDQEMMVAMWQDSQYARWANADGNTDYAAYANTPMIYISVTPDNGTTWSEPIVLDNVRTPEFAGLKPMWVYPANKVIYVGEQDGHKVGKIGIMFYDDNTWGAFSIENPVHPTNDGGTVMFTELQIVFPLPGDAVGDNTVTPVTSLLNQNYPNPFNPETTISFDMPKTSPATLAVYNVKGQLVKTLFDGNATFGKNNVVWNGTDSKGSKVSSGIYFYRLSTNGKVENRKMMLMK